MRTIDELDALHAAATAGEWESVLCDAPHVDHDAVRMIEGPVTRGKGEKFIPIISRISPRADADFIAAAKNAWPSISARLRAAEAANARLRSHYDAAAPEHNLLALLDLYEGRRLEAVAEVARLRGLVRWFLDGDDHTHEDDCGARGQHDIDVCRNTKPCGDDTCEGPHCTCDATEMRARARAALGEP